MEPDDRAALRTDEVLHRDTDGPSQARGLRDEALVRRKTPGGLSHAFGLHEFDVFVGLSAGSRVGRIFRREGISVDGDARALRIELHVVVEHGLNLAEVASTVRSQVAYEVERLTGLGVNAVEVVIQRVRASA